MGRRAGLALEGERAHVPRVLGQLQRPSRLCLGLLPEGLILTFAPRSLPRVSLPDTRGLFFSSLPKRDFSSRLVNDRHPERSEGS